MVLPFHFKLTVSQPILRGDISILRKKIFCYRFVIQPKYCRKTEALHIGRYVFQNRKPLVLFLFNLLLCIKVFLLSKVSAVARWLHVELLILKCQIYCRI